MRQSRIAGPEDGVVVDILAELGLQRGLDVDGRQDPEALVGERVGHGVDGGLVIEIDLDSMSDLHRQFLPCDLSVRRGVRAVTVYSEYPLGYPRCG